MYCIDTPPSIKPAIGHKVWRLVDLQHIFRSENECFPPGVWAGILSWIPTDTVPILVVIPGTVDFLLF